MVAGLAVGWSMLSDFFVVSFFALISVICGREPLPEVGCFARVLAISSRESAPDRGDFGVCA